MECPRRNGPSNMLYQSLIKSWLAEKVCTGRARCAPGCKITFNPRMMKLYREVFPLNLSAKEDLLRRLV